MVTVKTKEELAKAIDNGETKIKVEGKKLQAACCLAAKYQNLECALDSLKNKLLGQIGMACAITEGTIVIISLAILMTAVAIIAILKKRNVKINYKEGTIEVS